MYREYIASVTAVTCNTDFKIQTFKLSHKGDVLFCFAPEKRPLSCLQPNAANFRCCPSDLCRRNPGDVLLNCIKMICSPQENKMNKEVSTQMCERG